MTYGEFKKCAENIYPNSKNHFSIEGSILLKMPFLEDDCLNALKIKSYKEKHFENEDGTVENWFFVTAKEEV